MAEKGRGPWGWGGFMTSAVRGGIRNLSRHVDGFECDVALT